MRKTLKVWRSVMMDRLADCRGKFSKTESEKVHKDREQLDQYKSLISSVDHYIDCFVKKTPLEEGCEGRKVLLLTKDTTVQAMMTVSLLADSVYVDTLISAPWNIQMNGDNLDCNTNFCAYLG